MTTLLVLALELFLKLCMVGTVLFSVATDADACQAVLRRRRLRVALESGGPQTTC